ALMDEGQQIINQILKGDMRAWEKLENEVGISYRQIADKFYRAAELVGERHYYYNHLKSKGLYYESYAVYNLPISSDSAEILDLKLMKEALVLDPEAAYIWLNLCYISPFDSIDIYIKKLTDLTPRWSVWYALVADQYIGPNPIKAIQYYQKAIDLDSTYLKPRIWISNALSRLGKQKEADLQIQKVILLALAKAEKDSFSLAAEEWNALGNALRLKRQYVKAEWAFGQAKKLNPWVNDQWNMAFFLYPDLGKYTQAIEALEVQIKNSSKHWGYSLYGRCYYLMGDFIRAEQSFKMGLIDSLSFRYTFDFNRQYLAMLYRKTGNLVAAKEVLDAVEIKSPAILFALGEIQRLQNKEQEALQMFDSLLTKWPININKIPQNLVEEKTPLNYVFRIMAFHRLSKIDSMQQTIALADQTMDGDPWHHFWMACVFAQTGQNEQALERLNLAEKAGWWPNKVIDISGTVFDPFLDPLRHLPEFQGWEKRWSPPYKDYSKE
nr:tetratricopeptide repeat protein [Saprospiraceae bacterium]